MKLAEQEGARPDYEVKLRLVREEQEAIKREEAERKERDELEKIEKKEALEKGEIVSSSKGFSFRVFHVSLAFLQPIPAAPVLHGKCKHSCVGIPGNDLAGFSDVLVKAAQLKDKKPEDITKKDLLSMKPVVQEITKQDMEHIEDVIEKISKDKYTLLEHKDLKDEAQEYKEVNTSTYFRKKSIVSTVVSYLGI